MPALNFLHRRYPASPLSTLHCFAGSQWRDAAKIGTFPGPVLGKPLIIQAPSSSYGPDGRTGCRDRLFGAAGNTSDFDMLCIRPRLSIEGKLE